MIRTWLESSATVQKFRTRATFFTRSTAKLTFQNLLKFVLGNNRSSAQVALNDFFIDEDYEVTKQALFEAREKISSGALVELNEKIVSKFYDEDNVAKTYKSYTLLGADGSVYQLPQGALSDFGGQRSALSVTMSAQGRAVIISDVINRLTISARLEPVQNGEGKIYSEMLDELRELPNPLLIHDRGFYSEKLASKIQKKGLSFLFRVKRNCQKNIDAANEPDHIITLASGLKLRVINFILPTGENEKLVTNIFDEEMTVADFGEIYRLRWGVETTYLMLKERLAIENFTSAKKDLILQDFHAAVVAHNLTEIGCMEQELKHAENGADINRKNARAANRNITVREIRRIFIEIMCETDLAVINKKMAKIERIIYRFFEDVRPGRTFPRETKFPSKKYPMNKKRNL